MMRLILFETLAVPCSISLDKVLHVLTSPQLFILPLLRPSFVGAVVYQGQVIPMLAGNASEKGEGTVNRQPAFCLICEAEFGSVAIPADKIVRITEAGEVSSKIMSGCDSRDETCEIDDRDYRLLDLNQVLDDSDFTVCG
jgi:chemotaxis signal transduction protein